jgi:protein-S-isoprenylcysteine O-methyltransferase Ste14
MTGDDAVVGFRVWPPVAVGMPLVAGWVMSAVVGDPIALGAWRIPVGLALVAAFVVWNGWALWSFGRHQTGLLPGQATTSMIEDGPYRWSRNPLYVGLLGLSVGVALLTASVWALILLPAAVALLLWGAILPEERFLRARFGAPYDAYARRVRRWL